MAKKTSEETIAKINELYAVYGIKSKVAAELGISASTVTKYLDPDYKITSSVEPASYKYDFSALEPNWEYLAEAAFSALCVLSEEEKAEMTNMAKTGELKYE